MIKSQVNRMLNMRRDKSINPCLFTVVYRLICFGPFSQFPKIELACHFLLPSIQPCHYHHQVRTGQSMAQNHVDTPFSVVQWPKEETSLLSSIMMSHLTLDSPEPGLHVINLTNNFQLQKSSDISLSEGYFGYFDMEEKSVTRFCWVSAYK